MKMQVELRKAQAAERSSFGWMYARALGSGCGPFQDVCMRYAPGMTVTERYEEVEKKYKDGYVTREFTRDRKSSGGLDSEGNWNFHESHDVTSYGPTAPPIKVTVSQTRVAGDTTTAQPAELVQSSSSTRGGSADAETTNTLKADWFIWAAIEVEAFRAGSVAIANEYIGVAGFNELGPYYGYIDAAGVSVGEKGEGYGASMVGIEVIWQYDWTGGVTKEMVWVGLVEGGAGPVVVGGYSKDLTSTGSGMYAGAKSEHVSGGVGFNLEYLRLIWRSGYAQLGTLLPLRGGMLPFR
jgi:hypothetical protein